MSGKSSSRTVLRMDIKKSPALPQVTPCENADCHNEQKEACELGQFETVLQVIPGKTPADRLQVVHVERCDGTRLLLRQQNRADGIGWFTQSSVEVHDGQVGALQLALQASPQLTSQGRYRSTVGKPRLKIVS